MNREGACVDFKPAKNRVVLTDWQGPPEGALSGAPQSREMHLPVRKILSPGLRSVAVSWVSDMILSLGSGRIETPRSSAAQEPPGHRPWDAGRTSPSLS